MYQIWSLTPKRTWNRNGHRRTNAVGGGRATDVSVGPSRWGRRSPPRSVGRRVAVLCRAQPHTTPIMHSEAGLQLVQILEKTISPGNEAWGAHVRPPPPLPTARSLTVIPFASCRDSLAAFLRRWRFAGAVAVRADGGRPSAAVKGYVHFRGVRFAISRCRAAIDRFVGGSSEVFVVCA